MLLGSELSRQKNCKYREILVRIKTTKLILVVFKCSNREIFTLGYTAGTFCRESNIGITVLLGIDTEKYIALAV